MRYQITKQFAKDKEMPAVECDDLRDAELFLSAKILADDANHLKLIYRLYDHANLVGEYNKDKINTLVARAQYAQGDIDLPSPFAEPFRVFKQTDNAAVITAKFCDINDAKLFIEMKLTGKEQPANETYILYNGKQLLEKIDQGSIGRQASQAQAKESQAKEQKAGFRPTPFATTLRLGPAKWWVDEEDEDDGKKK